VERIGAGRRRFVQLPLRLPARLVLAVPGRYVLTFVTVHCLLLCRATRLGAERLPRGWVEAPMGLTAQQAFDKAGRGKTVIGWKLDREQRKELLLMFPATYDEPVADHVTLAAGVGRGAALPSEDVAEIVGRSDDGRGVEAMIVRLSGTIDRPDGSVYHVTWSLSPSRRPKESNDAIRDCGWTPFDLPVPIQLVPARF
jgi:hypothetical protein